MQAGYSDSSSASISSTSSRGSDRSITTVTITGTYSHTATAATYRAYCLHGYNSSYISSAYITVENTTYNFSTSSKYIWGYLSGVNVRTHITCKTGYAITATSASNLSNISSSSPNGGSFSASGDLNYLYYAPQPTSASQRGSMSYNHPDIYIPEPHYTYNYMARLMLYVYTYRDWLVFLSSKKALGYYSGYSGGFVGYC